MNATNNQPLITATQLKLAAPLLTGAHAESLAALISEICPKYGMDTSNKLEEFLATIIEESGQFQKKTENLTYGAPRLAEVWPFRFAANPHARIKVPNALALKLQHNPEALANTVYASRLGNGNAASGDGFAFRGGGFMQLTFRSLYAAYAKYAGMDIKAATQLIQTTDRWALDSAAWYFCKAAKLLDEAVLDQFTKITKACNGALINMDVRLMYLAMVKKALTA